MLLGEHLRDIDATQGLQGAIRCGAMSFCPNVTISTDAVHAHQ